MGEMVALRDIHLREYGDLLAPAAICVRAATRPVSPKAYISSLFRP